METIDINITAPTFPVPAELVALDWRGRVRWLRQHRLDGLGLVLAPYTPEFGEPLRLLRNRPENQFNLAQGGALSPEQQQAWGRAYLTRDNDLCWIVLTPDGKFAGATRLYDIDGDASTAEKGGLVLQAELARVAPLALESEIMLLRVAFAWLGLARVITQVRPENLKMISINDRLGFRPAGEATLRGVPYLRADLSAARFDPTPLLPILRHWKNRHVS